MAWAAAAALLLLLVASEGVRADAETGLGSVLVIGSEQAAGGSKRKLLQQMTGEPEPLMKWLVNKHNELRYRHGVQLLTWDWSLAWNAYNYITACPTGHSGQQGIGENLAWGHNDFNHAMRDWYDEIQFYNFNAPGFAENTGHFTQMVWRDAGKIGCAANLRCSFRTYICQFTPAGNLVNYGGSVDHQLWTTNVPAPSAQFVTGTKPDGSPSYMSYDPTGATTRGLPQPRYGELKNFGYVPKPGEVIVMTDWQKYIPTDIMQAYLPWVVLETYLKPDILALLKPEPPAVPKPGQPIHKEPQRAVIGWQQFLPASVVKQYIPEQVLAKYVPEGVVLATEKDQVGAYEKPAANATSTAVTTTTPATAAPAGGNAPAVGGPASKLQEVPKEPPSFVAAAAAAAAAPSGIFAAPMKEPYEAGPKHPSPSRHLLAAAADSTEDQQQGAVFFREEPAQLRAAQAHTSSTTRKVLTSESAAAATTVSSAQARAEPHQQQEQQEQGARRAQLATRAAVVQEQGALDRLFGGLGDSLRDDSSLSDRKRDRYGYARDAPQPPVAQQQPAYPVAQTTPVYGAPAAGYSNPVRHVPSQQQQQQPASYYVQQPYPPQQQQQQQQPQQQQPQQQPNQYGQLPQALPPQPPGYQPTAAVPLPTSQQQPGQAAQQGPGAPQQQQQQLPAGLQDALDAHNFYRARHQAPAVVWDDQLAASALGVASACPNGPSGTQGIGENLAWGFRDAGAGVDEWYKEGKQYDSSNPGFTMTSGHFSQIVWADTQRLGCALVATCSMPTLICHYFPPGNIMGADWSTQVKPPPPGAPAGPRPRQPPPAPALPPGYPYQTQQQQPVAAVPYPGYQQQQQQPVAAVPYPSYPAQQQQQQQPVPAVTAVPNPAYIPPQQQQQQQPVAAVEKPAAAGQQATSGHLVTYPTYTTYQPYPTAAVPKPPHRQFVPVVGGAADPAPAAAKAPRKVPEAGPFSAPAIPTTAAAPAAADGTEPTRPMMAATTKPFSAPALMTTLADAVPKPAVSSTGKLPDSAPAQLPDGQLVAAVDKPPFPVAPPRSYWPRVSTPVSSNGAPFSLSAPTHPAAAAVLSPELQAALDRHNELRAAHQAPPLTWDDSIASSAQAWAAGCPDGHSGTRGVGENMAWGYSSLSAAVDAWYNEVQQYNFASPGWNTATGHFTALVWRSTTKLGCALNAACSWPTYVCQYGPPGNVIGLDWSEEVKPKSEVPAAPVTPSQPSIPTPTTAPKEPGPNPPSEPTQPTNPTPAPVQPKEPPTPDITPVAPAKPSPAPAKTPAAKKPAASRKAAAKGPKLTAEQKVALDKHNRYRSKHSTPALAWDAKLAAAAQAWADRCPWTSSDLPYGENMAFGYDSFGDALDAWYSELSDYDWSHPAYQPGTGHASQMLWRGSSKLGCAVSKNCEWKTYVCLYDPPGNIDGDAWGANMLPLGGAKPQVAAVLKPGSSGESRAPRAVAAVLKPEYQAALDRHNKHRQTHQAPALVWDDALAASAAKWAAGCPNGHSGYAGVGENMAWGYSSLTAAVDAWYNEVQQYNFASPGWNTATGHFTALVWRSTTKLGCATNTACGWATYVCQYQTPGNIIGLDWSLYVKPALAVATPASSPAPKAPATSPAPAPAKLPAPVVLPKPSPAPIKASPSPAPAVKASTVLVSAAPKASDMQKVLEMHNAYRRTHQAPPLVWDEKLAGSAKKWADTCTFGVSRTPRVGEALGFGYATFPDAVKGWYNQVSRYDFSSPGWKSGSGLFTQMVWRSSKGVGCAVNTACTWATYVCHYSPPGNMVGPSVDWRQEVKPALTTAAVPKPGDQASAVGSDNVAPGAVEDQAWDAQDRQPDEAQATADVRANVPTSAAVPFPDSVSTATSAEPADSDLAEALRRSNQYRKRHQVAPLSWDDGLASQAAAFLADCPLKHSTIRNVGESLGWGFRSITDVVDAWYSEFNSYNFNKPGWSILAGHFSQMVWRDTTHIGCAVNKACTWDTYVCQYSPPGNAVTADWSMQVFPALPETPEDTQQLSNPMLLPGEAYYNSQRGSDSSSSSSTLQQYASPVLLDQLAQQQQAGSTPPPAPITPPATPAAAGSQDDPLEIPVTPSAPSEVTPSQPGVPPATPAPQQPAGVPTMPADQLFPQTGSSSSSDSQAAGGAAPAAPASSNAAAGSSDGAGSVPVPGLSAELQAGLDASNSYRRQHASPELTWDASIASQAAAYVAGCPTGHSNMKGFGENLAWGYDSLAAAVTAWYDEVSAYDFSKGGFTGATGHFTALVWRDTTKVGCAVNKACSMPTYICQYSPPGNVMGVDWSKQVQRKGASAAAPAAQPAPATPATPTQPAAQQQPQQPQQQQPVQPHQPPPNWWEPPTWGSEPQQQQQQPMEPTAPTPLTPTPATPATTPASAAADGSAPAAYSVVFAASNTYRAKHQVPALTWDAALAARSQAYADSCPGGHSGDKGVGENLAWGYPSWQSAVDAWYNEVQTYSFSNPGWSGATGHFTQLVWKDTTKIGCGYNSRCAMATYVCQYSPAGNVLGDGWSAQVLPATS